jgi:glutathione-independent formaldehyde dehydrogenase
LLVAGTVGLLAAYSALLRGEARCTVNFGRTQDRRYTTLLRDLILTGRARPGRIVTHHRTLNDAPGFYESFDRRADGVVKAVLGPS